MCWKSIKAISSAVYDVTSIAVTEASFQIGKAVDASNSASETLATKAATLKANYLNDLENRKAGITKSAVVTETEIPVSAVQVN